MEEKKTNYSLIQSKSKYGHIINLYENNDAVFDEVHFPTGFPELDRALDGGLTAGLSVVGAISSLGKTTFALQIADNIARNKLPVLIFSLEMRPEHLLAKNMSRYMYECALEKSDIHADRHAKSYSELMKESVRKGLTDEELTLHKAAIAKAKQVEDYIEIISEKEDGLPFNIDDIVGYVEWYIKEYKAKPFVVIDYLQFVRPSLRLPSGSDKQNTDNTVSMLVSLAKRERIPIMAISSLNRIGYDKPVGMESFKESGLIEYSAEILLGGQLKGVGTEDFDVNEAKSRIPREIEIILIKGRGVNTGTVINYKFLGRHNYFEEEGFVRVTDEIKVPFEDDGQEYEQLEVF